MVLLVMDMQLEIVNRFAQASDVLTPTNAAITAARAASIPVIYVVIGFRPGFPEISPRNKSFSATKQRSSSSTSMFTLEIHPAIAPLPTTIVVTKRRVSAFTWCYLELL